MSLASGCPAAARRARLPARMLLRLICRSGGGPPRGCPRTMMAHPERTCETRERTSVLRQYPQGSITQRRPSWPKAGTKEAMSTAPRLSPQVHACGNESRRAQVSPFIVPESRVAAAGAAGIQVLLSALSQTLDAPSSQSSSLPAYKSVRLQHAIQTYTAHPGDNQPETEAQYLHVQDAMALLTSQSKAWAMADSTSHVLRTRAGRGQAPSREGCSV